MKRFLIMWLLLLIIIYQVLYSSSSSSSISNPNHLCPHEHRLILLQFKQMFVIDPDQSSCGDYDEPSYPKTVSWNESSTNCCSWDGVTCDDHTGHVVGIDLSCSQLSVTFHPNTTLFQLPLKSLDLSFNNFQQSHIPSSIGMLAPTLTHLNISYSNFTGSIPSEIAHLSKLVLLNLWDDFEDTPSLLRLEQHDFQNIITNLTQLEILSLANINMSSSIIPDSIVNLTSLTSLTFIKNGLYGQVPDGVFNLPALQKLYIRNNDGLKGSFHNVNWNISGNPPPLEALVLSSISFSGGLPDSIGHLRSLHYLRIDDCNLSGSLPGSIGNLSQLIVLTLVSNKFSGLIPRSLSNINELKYLYLKGNQFEGQIPTNITGLRNLIYFDLRNNLLQGSIPVGLFELPNLIDILLDNNLLSGALPSIFFNNHSMLSSFIISRNNLSGPIPQFITNLKDLCELDLSSNNFDGTLYLDTFSNMKYLNYIKLGNNENLSVIDAYGNFSTIISLDLSSCKLQNFPFKFFTTSRNLQHLVLSNNKIKGEIPSSICTMSSLDVLDLSQNELEGPIHPCFGNFSATLSILNLRKNNLSGRIPATYVENNMLTILALNENELQGPIPESLSLCNNLQVIDLGNNMINGTFPIWMEALPELQVLVLRSNKFHGFVNISKTPSPFSKLRIFDISHNEFSGPLPSYYFNNFNGMKKVNQKVANLESLAYGYQFSVTMTMKGFDFPIKGFILQSRTIIDLSSNKFEGAISDVVGNLVGLTMLNMSNNRLTGHIPVKLGNLVELEHLDLSSNQFTGKIPQKLTSLTFLGVLNLSCNGLEGRIPQGKQFDTFSNTSYMENVALCGLPLSRKCQGHEMATPPTHDESEDDSDYAFMRGFTWQSVLMGYASGMIIGLGAGSLSFYTGRPNWFATMIDEERYKIIKKYRVRRISSLMKLH